MIIKTKNNFKNEKTRKNGDEDDDVDEKNNKKIKINKNNINKNNDNENDVSTDTEEDGRKEVGKVSKRKSARPKKMSAPYKEKEEEEEDEDEGVLKEDSGSEEDLKGVTRGASKTKKISQSGKMEKKMNEVSSNVGGVVS